MTLSQKIFLSIFPFQTTASFAQQGQRYTVQDALTQEPISYATVGLLRKNIGLTTDTVGQFTWSTPRPTDTFWVTAFGYQPLRTTLAAFPERVVLLQPAVRSLNEVQIKPRSWNQRLTLNPFNPKRVLGTQSSDGGTSQIAQHFYAPTASSVLDQVIIYTNQLRSGGHRKGRFSVRIYGIDSTTGGPGLDLCKQPIDCSSKGKRLVLDLRPYKIFLSRENFFVAIEWLKIPDNEYQIKEALSKTQFRTRTLYYPSVVLKERQDNTPSNCWMKNYQGTWRLVPNPLFGNYGIEAQLRY